MIHATVTVSPPPSVSASTPKHIHISGVAYGARMSTDYNDLQNKPSINGVTLDGNKTTEDLHIQAGVTSWNGETGDVTYTAPVTSVNGQTGDVTISIPPVPVESVNGQTGDVVLSASDVGALPDSYAAPVSSVNSKTGAVVLDASDVGAIPDTTTFALGYDPDCSVGLAKVGDAVTDEPFYTPSGQIEQTMEEVSFMTGGTAELTTSYYNGTLTLGVLLTPTTATKNVATSVPVFVGNGVNFVIEEES